ncbi:MAG: hypothetical protein WAT39_01840 [Planctomycetota bacterium]
MASPGPHKGIILSHRTRTLGDKLAVSLTCEVGTEKVEAIVFVTEKAMGMARRALKLCGFNVDEHDMSEIDDVPDLLAGNEIPLVAEFYNGKLQWKVDIDSRADKATLADVTQKLRAAKHGTVAAHDDGESTPASTVAAKQARHGDTVNADGRVVVDGKDYGDIPFLFLFALPLLGAFL